MKVLELALSIVSSFSFNYQSIYKFMKVFFKTQNWEKYIDSDKGNKLSYKKDNTIYFLIIYYFCYLLIHINHMQILTSNAINKSHWPSPKD